MNEIPRNLKPKYAYFSLIIILLFTGFLLVFDYFTLFYNKRNNSDSNYYSINRNDLKKNDTKSLKHLSDNKYLKILIMADSHLNKEAFSKIKLITENFKVNSIIHLGDHTDYGSVSEIQLAKEYLDSLGKDYVVLPGDRDLAAAGDDSIFYDFFNKTDTFQVADLNFLLINNSPNFTTLENRYLNYLTQEIPKADIILSSQPIFVEKGNIFESKFMGSLDKDYLAQRNLILDKIRESKVRFVISGDHHRSSSFIDPIRKDLRHQIVGATAENLNSNGLQIKQKSFQSQRVLIISISQDSEILIDELEIFEE